MLQCGALVLRTDPHATAAGNGGAGGPTRPLFSTAYVSSASPTYAVARTVYCLGRGQGACVCIFVRVAPIAVHVSACVRVAGRRKVCARGSDVRFHRMYQCGQTMLIGGEGWLAHPPYPPCRCAVNIAIRAASSMCSSHADLFCGALVVRTDPPATAYGSAGGPTRPLFSTAYVSHANLTCAAIRRGAALPWVGAACSDHEACSFHIFLSIYRYIKASTAQLSTWTHQLYRE
jgi:hypothetical protein